jgi:hypothetical protein
MIEPLKRAHSLLRAAGSSISSWQEWPGLVRAIVGGFFKL